MCKKYTNYPKIAILVRNSNFKPLRALEMMYFNIITPPPPPWKFCFVMKMKGNTTLYNKWFRRYENSIIPPKTSKCNQLFMKMTSHFHKLHLIRKTSMVKVAKKLLCWKSAQHVPICPTIYSLLVMKEGLLFAWNFHWQF